MQRALAITRKELTLYFTTPMAYVVLTAMMLVSSFFFVSGLESFHDAQDYAREHGWAKVPAQFRNLTDGVVLPLWQTLVVLTLFLGPFLSMRLFAEEKRAKTFELLMTTPVRPLEIVLGKYVGALVVISVTLAVTAIYPVSLELFGRSASDSGWALEWPTVALGYAGMLLWGATCVAIGMFMSSTTESQMVAAVLSFAVLLPWLLAGVLAFGLEEPFRSIVAHLSFQEQLQSLLSGVLDLKAIVFFVSIIALSLVLTHRAVQAQRWT